MIHFAWPWIWLLLPLPFALYKWSRVQKKQLTVIKAITLPYLSPNQQAGQKRSQLNKVLLALAWVMILLALARPQWLGKPVMQSYPARDIMIALDTSKTMGLTDMATNGKNASRLDAVRTYLDTWISNRQGDRLGLLLFGTHAAIDVPFTEDLTSFTQLFNLVTPGMIGDKTAIGEAVILATQKMMNEPYEHRILILISDGIDTAQSMTPEHAAMLAKTAGIRIYTIGVGADNPDSQSPNYFDDTDLNKIAQLTGGHYFRARSEQDLSDINLQLEQLEPKELRQHSFQPYDDLFYWPAGLAVLLLLLLMGRIHHD